MTEDEAKTKWCPFARVLPATLKGGYMTPLPDIPAHNRVQEAGEDEATWHGASMCIGSACMAWRRGPQHCTIVDGAAVPTVGVYTGYCGLAGRP